jgi:hypothetical protein
MNRSERDHAHVFREKSFSLVPAFLDRSSLRELRRACDVALDSARKLEREIGHTTPSIPVLTEASYFQDEPHAQERIAALLGSVRVCKLLSGIEETGARVPALKDASYYHEQTRRDWDGDWHRDSQFRRPDQEAERALIATTLSVHFRVAFEDDDRLEIVPGSHARWDTEDELRIRKGPQRTRADMPGAARIVLRAGDACVFHAWSIHRATYRRSPVRRTIDALYTFS